MRDRKAAARINAVEMPVLVERIPCDLNINDITRLEGRLLDGIINLKAVARQEQKDSLMFSGVDGAYNLHLWLTQPVPQGAAGPLMLPASLRLKRPTCYQHVAELRSRYSKTLEEQTELLDRLGRDLAGGDLVSRQMFWMGAEKDTWIMRDLQASISYVLYSNLLSIDILLASLIEDLGDNK